MWRVARSSSRSELRMQVRIAPARFGIRPTNFARWHIVPRLALLAIQNAPASTRAVPPTAALRETASRSSGFTLPFLECFDHAPDLVQFSGRRRLRRQGAHEQALSGTFKRADQQVARNLLLGLLFGHAGFIDMRPEAFTANDQTLIRHQLHLFEGGRVA